MKCSSFTCHRIQQGMALISAIFILVVLALIGAFAVHVSTMQHVSSAQDVQSVRAYQAARAGLEWALFRVQTVNGGLCAGATNLNPAGDTFAGLTVTVTCGGTAEMYQITSYACNQPASGTGRCPNTGGFNNMYIERRLEARLRTDNS
jgi:MSHA biogenesis protein MshP